MQRPRCSVYIATSLDGLIARKDGRLDWLSIVERPGEDYGYARFFASIDTLVMGRKTYETALSFEPWPYAGKRTVVLTHAAPAPRHGESFYSGDLGALVEQLARDGARHVYVDGGTVLSQFLALGLVDDVTVSIIPVLLGEGVPLTQHLGRDVGLRLVESRSFESGLVQLEYRVEPAQPFVR
jgi:dihydrofolate reductase